MNIPLRIFIGHDHRQPISYNVLQQSIARHASRPITISPLILPTLPTKRAGLTPFTFSRYLVPWLCGYKGSALFLDADILVLADIVGLFELGDQDFAVHVVKNPRRFEWASVMLFNCGHKANKALTPDWLNATENDKFINNPFKFSWLEGGDQSPLIGALPTEWNHLVGYDKPRDDAKLVHFTMGVPCFEETQMSEYGEAWRHEAQLMNGAVPWVELMGNSVHASHLPDGRILPHFHPDVRAAAQPGSVGG